MSIYDTLGSYLFWAPWIGLIALLSPLLIMALVWRIYPTSRWVFLLLPLCLSTLLILYSPLYIYFIVVFDLLAVSAVVLDLLTITGPSGLSVERHMLKSASLGGTHDVRLCLDNRSDRTQLIDVCDDLPAGLTSEPEAQPVVLEPGKRTEVDYKIRPLQRGSFAFHSIYLRLKSRVGLWQRQVKKDCPGEMG